MISIEFFLASLVVIAVPGTGVIYTVSTAVSKGRASGVVAAFGCTLGIVPHLAATLFGLVAIVHASAMAFQAVRYVGVLYLLYVAYQMWNHADLLAFEDSQSHSPGILPIVGRAVLINLLNPRLTFFFLAFIPQFVPQGLEGDLTTIATLGLVFMLLTFIVFVGYAVLASAARRVFQDSRRARVWTQRGSAIGIAGLAVQSAICD